MNGLSIKPINCHQCPDCYEAKIVNAEWNIGRVMATLREYDGIRREWKKRNPKQGNLSPHSIHGGEPLLLKFNDLHELLRYNYSMFGRSGIQTNLLYINKKHIDLFKRYNTSVGISFDGHLGYMNKGRFPDSKGDIIKRGLAKILRNMGKLKSAGISMSIISMLRECNSGVSDILEFMYFVKDEYDINHMRFTACTIYNPDNKAAEISPIKLFGIYSAIFSSGVENDGMSVAPINEFVDGMMGHIGNMSCSSKDCDPWRSTAEITAMGNGELGSCLHAGGSLDGLQIQRGDISSHERSDVLKQIPQESGGCSDCKFWHMCKGGCPGQAINNDWRNKTRFCLGLKMTFNHIYDKLKSLFPNIYLTPDFYPDLPDAEYIKKSISKSVNRRCDKIASPKAKGKEWVPIIENGISHQDSNNQEWLKLNPGWGEK